MSTCLVGRSHLFPTITIGTSSASFTRLICSLYCRERPTLSRLIQNSQPVHEIRGGGHIYWILKWVTSPRSIRQVPGVSQGVRASEPDFPKYDLKACPDMRKIHKMSVKRQIKVFEMIVLLMTTKCTHSDPERGQTTLILLYLTSGWYSSVFEFLWLLIKSLYNKCDRLTPYFRSSWTRY